MPKTNDTRANMIHRMELRMKSNAFPPDHKSRKDKWASMDMASKEIINKFGTTLLDFVCGYYELPRRRGAAERKALKLLLSIGYAVTAPEKAKGS